MTTTTRDRISVDLRGLRAALFEQARARGVSPSDVVRDAVHRSLGQPELKSGGPSPARNEPRSDRVRLSLRLSRQEASALVEAAEASGLPVGAYVAGLAAGLPLLAQGGKPQEHLTALVASSAELVTLVRNIHHLTTLLRQGDVQPALAYAQTLQTLDRDVRAHLALAAAVLAGLRPLRPTSGAGRPTTLRRRSTCHTTSTASSSSGATGCSTRATAPSAAERRS